MPRDPFQFRASSGGGVRSTSAPPQRSAAAPQLLSFECPRGRDEWSRGESNPCADPDDKPLLRVYPPIQSRFPLRKAAACREPWHAKVSFPQGMPALGNQPDVCRSPASSGVRRGDRADQLGRECVLRIGRRVVHHFYVA